jgi:hypothetical protein
MSYLIGHQVLHFKLETALHLNQIFGEFGVSGQMHMISTEIKKPLSFESGLETI